MILLKIVITTHVIYSYIEILNSLNSVGGRSSDTSENELLKERHA